MWCCQIQAYHVTYHRAVDCLKFINEFRYVAPTHEGAVLVRLLHNFVLEFLHMIGSGITTHQEPLAHNKLKLALRIHVNGNCLSLDLDV